MNQAFFLTLNIQTWLILKSKLKFIYHFISAFYSILLRMFNFDVEYKLLFATSAIPESNLLQRLSFQLPLLSNRRCSLRHFSRSNFCTYFLTWKQTPNSRTLTKTRSTLRGDWYMVPISMLVIVKLQWAGHNVHDRIIIGLF